MEREIIKALAEWVICIAGLQDNATPDAIRALPEVARLCMDYSSLMSSEVKRA